jgi:hypothetical protein
VTIAEDAVGGVVDVLIAGVVVEDVADVDVAGLRGLDTMIIFLNPNGISYLLRNVKTFAKRVTIKDSLTPPNVPLETFPLNS